MGIDDTARTRLFLTKPMLLGHWRDGNGTRKVQADGSRMSHAWRVMSQVAPGRDC